MRDGGQRATAGSIFQVAAVLLSVEPPWSLDRAGIAQAAVGSILFSFFKSCTKPIFAAKVRKQSNSARAPKSNDELEFLPVGMHDARGRGAKQRGTMQCSIAALAPRKRSY